MGVAVGLEMKLMQKFEDADIIVYGHTHQSKNEHIGKTLFFNPGPGSRSYGILTISDKGIAGRIVTI
jgi:predicted phosphodiesterase